MITKEQYGLWKHDPVSKWFFEFLRDKQAFLKASALDQWLANSAWPETVRGQIIELDEVIHLEHQAIQEFYRKDDGTEPEGSER